MVQKREFAFKKAQIEQFLKKEYNRQFGRGGRISVRKRQRFMSRVSQKVGKRFGKDVLCLIDFSRGGFVTLVSPAHTESTDKGRLFQSFIHPQVAYTSHCVERFSERTDTTDNCIIALDDYLHDGLLTFGEHKEYMICNAGIFAYVIEDERLIIKTFINFEMLSDSQIREFYGSRVLSMMTEDVITEEALESDIILGEEEPDPARPPER